MFTRVFALMLLLVSGPAALFGQNGGTGLPFLKLGVGARPVAMGEAYAALTGDPSALFYNPATIGSANPEILLMHKSWIAGTTTDYLGSIVPGEAFSFGFGILSNTVDDIEIREQPGPADGTFAMHDVSLAASAELPLDSTLSLGVTAKYLYEKIYVDETSGGAADVGAFWRMEPTLALGAVVTNLGSMNSLRSEAPRLPAGFRVGAAWHDSVGSSMTATGSADLVKVFGDTGMRLHLGAEVSYDGTFALRAGYQFGYDAKGLSAGIGIAYGLLAVDYAYVPFTNSLGTTHTFAVTFRL